MSDLIMPLPTITRKSGRVFQPVFTHQPWRLQVLARIEAQVLAASTPCSKTTMPLCLVVGADGSPALTFSNRAYRVTRVHFLQDRIRLERKECFESKVRLEVWVEVPPRIWNLLFVKAQVLPTVLTYIVYGPEPTPVPPALPLARNI